MGEGGIAQGARDLGAGSVREEEKFLHFIGLPVENVFLQMFSGLLIEKIGKVSGGIAGVLRDLREPETAVEILVDLIDSAVYDHAVGSVLARLHQLLEIREKMFHLFIKLRGGPDFVRPADIIIIQYARRFEVNLFGIRDNRKDAGGADDRVSHIFPEIF